MSSIWTLKEKSQGELAVTITGDAWKKAQKKALDKIIKAIKIDGFRQGQAPLALVKKQVSQEQILMEAIELNAQKVLEEGFKEHAIESITRPTLEVKSVNEEEASVVFTITVRPVVTLGQYKGLSLTMPEIEVTEEEINLEIGHILENYAELVLKEDADAIVEHGDIAVINFDGYVDGVAFDGGKAENYPLEIGSGNFIPGFEEQLIGVKTGEHKDVVVSFPEQYGEPKLAGQEAMFKCTVNEIKRKELPAITDEIVAELQREAIHTVEELTADIKSHLLQTKTEREEATAFEVVLETISKESKVEVPDVMIQEEADNLMIEFSQRLQQSGYTIDAFSEATGQTEEEVKTQMWEDAADRVRTRLILEAIAMEEGLKVTPEEIDVEYETIAKRYNMEVARVRQMARVDMLSYDLVLRKASDLVKESCK